MEPVSTAAAAAVVVKLIRAALDEGADVGERAEDGAAKELGATSARALVAAIRRAAGRRKPALDQALADASEASPANTEAADEQLATLIARLLEESPELRSSMPVTITGSVHDVAIERASEVTIVGAAQTVGPVADRPA